MKIKNMKLMLLGLLAMVGMNGYAQHTTADKIVVDGYDYYYVSDVLDETGRSVSNIVYDLRTVTWKNYDSKTTTTKEATVVGVNASATDAEVATIAIPKEVEGDKGTYQVTWINNSTWVNAEKQKDVRDKTTSLSLDLTNLWPGSFSAEAYKSFSKLTTLTIKEASTTETPNASVFNGQGCAFQLTLTTLNLTESRINQIAEEGLAGFTALTSFDFGENITIVGTKAFYGDYGISELTIPATVTTIGQDAFAKMVKESEDNIGLETLTINGCNKVGDDAVIPNAFSDNTLLTSLTIGSTIATTIEANAFKGDDALETIDLSGATALTSAAGAFDGSGALKDLVTLKMAGTKMTNLDIDYSGSYKTLETLTFPAGIENDDVEAPKAKLKNFIALTAIDLSETGVTVIPTAWLEFNATEAPDVDEDAEPSLTTVALNPETTGIGIWAFAGQSKLATITGLNQAALTTIGEHAFYKTAFTAVDLSEATNAAFTTIDNRTFADMPNLATVILPGQITTIKASAFANDAKIASINLEDTQIKVLNPIFHDGVVNASDAKEVAIKLATLELPEGLETIEDGALQLLDIEKIEIPATVTRLGARALQGCINLTDFTWNDATQRILYTSTFLGDVKLQNVRMITKLPENGRYTPIQIIYDGVPQDDAVDKIFKGNKKADLTFTVNAEDLAVLEANGWTDANLIYCQLSCEGASTFAFNEKAKTGEYYYATYYNERQATWFPAEDFEVFSAVVEGANVVLKAANVEEGYYKVAKYTGNNRRKAVCIVRSKLTEAYYELKNASFNDISSLPTDNGLQVVENEDGMPASRLKYQYKLGLKGGVLAFYRIASGTFAKGSVYINAEEPKDRLDIVIEGEATAIQGVATKVAENKGAIYNLNGVRVSKAQKGVYIQDGKKYIK